MKRTPLFGVAVLAAAVAACSGVEELGDTPCPPAGTQLSYKNFGAPFLQSYCVECHGGSGGHSSLALSTVELVRANAARIYANAANSNTAMPPGPEDPSELTRQRLGEWLSCGAP